MGGTGGRIVLGAWTAAILVIGAGLTALHQQTLPLPLVDAAVPTGSFRLVHAVSAACRCSQRVLDYLEQRGPLPDTEEQILLVDGDPVRAAALRALGFDVVLLDETRLEREHGIVSVPSLVVFRPDGTVAYRGAYAPRPQMDPVDTTLLARAREGEAIDSLPILGCAVSRALRERLDPLGLESLRRRP